MDRAVAAQAIAQEDSRIRNGLQLVNDTVQETVVSGLAGEIVLVERPLTFAQYVEWLNAVLRDNPHAADWEMPLDTPTPCFQAEGKVSLEAPP
ncbi:hypothetical protein [Streptomyces sp. NPDC052693]|uniref:hypothetical protein n=1 Tax=Streptomyces sp. NPDC052693 TaxID=3155814 RepID=UPI0034427E03